MLPDSSGGARPQIPCDVTDAEAGSARELWSWLPRLSSREAAIQGALARWAGEGAIPRWLDRGRIVADWARSPEVGRPEVVWGGSGLGRPGLIAQFRLPGRGTRFGMSLEVPIAHAVVDRLLGYERPFGETRLQLTPVEWGVWTYLIARALEVFTCSDDSGPSPTGDEKVPEIVLDRVGPDAFDPAGLGDIVTVRASVRIGSTTGTVRLWLPEPALRAFLDAQASMGRHSPGHTDRTSRARSLASVWRALAGSVNMPDGLKRLRKGGVLPLADTSLSGTPQDLAGPIRLACGPVTSGETFEIPVEPVAGASGRILRVRGPLECLRPPRAPLPRRDDPTMSSDPTNAPSAPGPTSAAGSPLDVPVTLVVELGRVSLTLDRLADLKTGDLIELGRHSREPVELTSNGRLVARGELILIDTELGVRVTHVFL